MKNTRKLETLGWSVLLSASTVLGLDSPALLAQTEPAVVSIQLPAEAVPFKPGPGADLARGHCLTCHSADYVYMQPPLPQDKWKAAVEKMRKVFGCQVPDGDIEPLAKYLAEQNGPRKPSP